MKILHVKPSNSCNHIGQCTNLPFYTLNNIVYVDKKWFDSWPAFRSANVVPIEFKYPNTGYIDPIVYNNFGL